MKDVDEHHQLSAKSRDMSLKSEIKFEIAMRTKYAFMRNRALPENTVVLHQMGKVGSMAIMQAIERSNLKVPVIHSHALSKRACDTITQNVISDREGLKNRRRTLFLNAVNRDRIRKTINKNKQINVITVVRDPISQIISSFFQIFEWDFRRWLGLDGVEDKTVIIDSCLEFITAAFESYYEGEMPNDAPGREMRYFIARPQLFYDQDFYDMWNFSVAENVSEVPNGGLIVNSPGARILLLRFEDLPESGDDSLKRFLSVTNLKMVSRNTTEGKGGNLPYIHKTVKETLRLKPAIVDFLYENPVMCSFYAQEERITLKDHWIRPS